jgi:hypothetical protein
MKAALQHIHVQMHFIKKVMESHPELADGLADVFNTLLDRRIDMIRQMFDSDTLNTLGLRHDMLMVLNGKAHVDATSRLTCPTTCQMPVLP